MCALPHPPLSTLTSEQNWRPVVLPEFKSFPNHIMVEYNSLTQRWAFDVFVCPAASCECERAFSSAKELITPGRNLLGDNIVKALNA
jgi:hypothetical protein